MASVGATKTYLCDSSVTFGPISHTVTSDTDVLLVLIGGGFSGWPELAGQFASMTWTATGASGQSMTEVALPSNDQGNNWSDEGLLFYLLENPNFGTASGAGQITISASGTVEQGMTFYVLNLIGIDTGVGTSGLRTHDSNSSNAGGSISVDLTTVAGDFCIGHYFGYDTSITWNSGHTEILAETTCNGGTITCATYEAEDTSTTVGLTQDPSYPCIVALAFAVSSADTTLEGSVSGSANTTGDLDTQITLASSVSGSVNTTGDLDTQITLASGVSGSAATTGDLALAKVFEASVSGTANTTGDLDTQITLDSSVSGSAATTGDLQLGIIFEASVTGSANTTGNLDTEITLASSVSGSVNTTGDLETEITLASSVSGSATALGTILVPLVIDIGETITQYCDSDSSQGPFNGHVVDEDTDLLLVYIIGFISGGGELASVFSSMTWTATGASGQSMTEIAADASDGGENWSDEEQLLYVLANPNRGTASGAGSITISYTGGDPAEGFHYLILNVIGVDTTVGTSGIRDTGSNSASSGTSISETLTTVDGDRVIANAYNYTSSSQSWANEITGDSSCNSSRSSSGYVDATGTSTTITVSNLNSSEWKSIFAIAIAPSVIDTTLEASVTGSANTTGDLDTQITLASSVSGTANTTGDLDTEITLASSVSGTANTTGDLQLGIIFEASVTGSANTTGDLDTQITLASSVSGSVNTTGDLETEITLYSSVSGTANTTGDLDTQITLDSSVSGTANTTGDLDTEITLASSVSGSANTTGDLALAKTFEASVTGSVNTTGDLDTEITLDSSVSGTAATTGYLEVGINLQSSVSGTANTTGDLETEITLASSVSGTANTTGDLSVPKTFEASVSGTANTTGDLDTQITLASGVSGTANTTGDLQLGIIFEASVTGSANTTGDLDTEIIFSAAASVSCIVTGALLAFLAIAGDVEASAAVQGDLETEITLVSGVSGTANTTGDLDTQITLASSVSGTANTTGDLVVPIYLEGDLTSTANTTGDLDTQITLFSSVSGTANTTGDLETEIWLGGAVTGTCFAQLQTIPTITPTWRTFDVDSEVRLFSANTETRELIIYAEPEVQEI